MKTFFTKSAIFLLGIFLLQSAISATNPNLIPNDIPEYKEKLGSGPEVLLLGDSATTFIHPSDISRQNLGEMLAQTLPGYKTVTIAYPASNPVIYEAIGQFIKKSALRPKVLVVAVNPRVFSPEWDKRPAFQFEYAKLSLGYYHTPLYPFLKFLIAMKMFEVDPVNQADFDATAVYNGSTVVGKVIDFESIKYQPFSDENMKKIITYFYMMNVRADHRQLQALVTLAEKFRNSDTKLLFYLTPIDYQAGQQYLGNQFFQRLSENTTLVRSTLKQHGFDVLDLTTSLDSTYFGWKATEYLYINEHLNDKGRLMTAQRIATEVKKILTPR